MATPCNPPNIPEERTKVSFDRKEVNDIRKKTVSLRQMLQDASLPFRNTADQATSQFSKAMEAKEAIWQNEVADIIHLKPQQRDAIGGLFASLFGYKVRGVIDPTETLSVAGAVREQLLRAGRVAENQLELAAKVEYARRAGDIIDSVGSIMNKAGLDKTTQRELLHDAMTVGQIPRLRSTYGATPGVEMLLTNQYNDFYQRALQAGLTPQHIETLVSAGERVSTVFDEMRAIAVANGLDMGNSQHYGYFPWNPTSDFQWRMNDFVTEPELMKELRSGNMGIGGVMKRSREAFHYVPEDDVLAASVLGMEPLELKQKMADPIEWRNFLHSKVAPETLDALVDTGVMSKLPMTSRDVFEYTVRQYQLPYNNLNEMFIIDPQKAVQTYADNLHRAVRDSAMYKYVASKGVDAGWAVTKDMIKNSPDAYKGFVPLTSIKGKFLESLQPEQLRHLDELYAHPIVAQQMNSMLDLATSPGKLGMMGQVWNYLQPLYSKSVIIGSNIGYLGRIFFGNNIALHAAGGHLGHLPQAMFDVFRSGKGFEHLDNSVPRFTFQGGEKLTEREAFQKLMLHSGITVAPLEGSSLHGVNFEALNPANAPKYMKQLWDYAMHNDLPMGQKFARLTKYSAKQFSKQINEVFQPLVQASQQMEQMYRWAAFRSIDTHRFQDFNALVRHLDGFFYPHDDPGIVGLAMRKSLVPFSSYMLQNTPAMVRFMLRSPQKFIAYNRLIQMWNSEQIDPNNPPPDGGFRATDMSRYPIILHHDPNSHEYVTLFPKAYDPILDSLTFLEDTGGVARHLLFGHYTGNSENQRNEAMGKAGLQRWLSSMLESTYWKAPVNVITGFDPFTGEVRKDSISDRNESFMGFRVGGLAKAFLSAMPPLETLNRANPMIPGTEQTLFGLKERSNEYGKSVRTRQKGIPELLNLPGAGARTEADSGKLVGTSLEGNNYARMAQLLGANVRVVNTAINMQTNLGDIRKSIQDIRGQIVPAQKQLALDTLQGKVSKDSPEYRTRAAEIDRAIDTWLQMEFDQRRIQLWMAKEHVPDKEVIQKLHDLQITGSMLPMPGASTTQRLMEEARKLRQRQVTGQ